MSEKRIDRESVLVEKLRAIRLRDCARALDNALLEYRLVIANPDCTYLEAMRCKAIADRAVRDMQRELADWRRKPFGKAFRREEIKEELHPVPTPSEQEPEGSER